MNLLPQTYKMHTYAISHKRLKSAFFDG